MNRNSLPNNSETLKTLLLDQIQSSTEKIVSLESKLKEKEGQIILLSDEVKLLRLRAFGKKSERWTKEDNEQRYLFNETEANASDQSFDSEKDEETTTISTHKRKRRKNGGRKKLPEHLPREVILHDLTDEQRELYKNGTLTLIGHDRSERLKLKPPEFSVEVHQRAKYSFHKKGASKSEVVLAPVFNQIIPKSIATPSLLSYLAVSKFEDHLPFYRLSRIFDNRMNVSISRETMCNWMMILQKMCRPLLERMHELLYQSRVINIDETTVSVLNDPERSKNSKNYVWVYRGELPDSKVILLFQYGPGRGSDIPDNYLKGYEGYIQTDGYRGYDKLCDSKKITHLFCWAHVRREFYEVLQVSPKSEHAQQAMDTIQKIFSVEDDAHRTNLSPNRLLSKRYRETVPLIEQFKSLLDNVVTKTPPKGYLGRAVNYALNHWHGLTHYLHQPFLRPDNNLAENAIRPFCVGRRNWLFFGNKAGAKASTSLYSLIETCKSNNIEPYYYLEWLFKQFEKGNIQDYDTLLPWNYPTGST